jgi:cellulose synthase/poly-beta-1,6-N-acetylglucosamine synthase-like glycosyltransferase
MAAEGALPGTVQASIVVPARNEEACLGRCLRSLTEQSGICFEIIVVDDGSTDRTRQIAESFPGVRLIQPGLLPRGWSGKVNAMESGARQARGRWLLFTDADTFHLPGSLARAIAEADKCGVGLLSYSPEQEARTFWEKAIMPVVFAELAASFRPAEVSNPKSAAAAANGQYLLISRDTYDGVGGFSSVAATLLEDVAMARAVKASGRKLLFRYAPDQVRTRMYRNFGQLQDGWTKNLALLFPGTTRLAILRSLEFILIVGCGGLAVLGIVRGRAHTSAAAFAIVAALYSLFLKRITRAHFPWDANLLSLLGLPLFSYLLLRSRLFHQRGKVSWKGRIYDGEPKAGTQLGAPLGDSESTAASRL